MLIFPVLPETLLIFMPLLLIVLYQMLLKLTLELKRSLHKLSRQNQTRLCRILPTLSKRVLGQHHRRYPKSHQMFIFGVLLWGMEVLLIFFFFPGQSYI